MRAEAEVDNCGGGSEADEPGSACRGAGEQTM